jgi:hypothetical protein
MVTHNSPVIVLTFAHSGVEGLRSLLSTVPDLVCTSGTGVIPLCDLAAITWRQVEARAGEALSAVAAASIRAMAASAITIILAREGKRRWCEFAFAQPSAAQTFLRLFPGTQFLCLHRACPDVIYSALHAAEWGLAGAAFAPFTAAYPTSSVQALAAYWVAYTEQLIAFEESHPGISHRIRCEDLVSDPRTAARILAFLTAADQHDSGPPRMDADTPTAGPDAPGCGAHLPVEQIPPPLLDRVNNLMTKLGYLPLAATPMSQS